jgi:maleylpyruvate isomerase
MKLVLYSYWRSSSSWRVRIGLHLKGVPFVYRAIHLLKDGGEQWLPEHLKRNPTGQVPVLEATGEDGKTHALGQSLAILEFLDEAFPAPPLLPLDPFRRARARQIAEIVNSGIQPYQNLSVLRRVSELGADGPTWAKDWISRGLAALESLVPETAGEFCVGDHPTIADCCLIPQLAAGRRFALDLSKYPTLLRIEAASALHPAFQAAHADAQPDAERT